MTMRHSVLLQRIPESDGKDVRGSEGRYFITKSVFYFRFEECVDVDVKKK